jgi:hypothetical protein
MEQLRLPGWREGHDQVRVGVWVDQPGQERLSGSVDDLPGRARERSNRGNPGADDGDIGRIGRLSRPIDHANPTNHQII